MNCLKCNKITRNPQFCSRSCSTSYNNSKNSKRKLTKTCIKCNCLIPSTRNKFCHTCRKPSKVDHTLREAQYKSGQPNAFSLVRYRSRAIGKKLNLDKQCFNCGYNKHVEICHIKPVASFPLNTKLSEINDPNNLIGLCPNCHWEFDHNILKIH